MSSGSNKMAKHIDTIAINDLDLSISSGKTFVGMELTPLELNQHSAIERVSKIIKTDNSYLIMDRGNFCVLEFDMDGKFLRKIISLGRGSMEYVRLADIEYNRFTGYLDLLDPSGKIISYDLVKGKFVKEILIQQQGTNLYGIHEFEYMRPDLIVFYSIFSERKVHLYDLEDREFTGSYFYIENELPAYLTSMRTLMHVNDQVLFLNTYDYTLYAIQENDAIPLKIFQLGEYDYRNNRALDNIKRGARESGQIGELQETMKNSNTLYPVFNYFPNSHFFQFLNKMNTVTMYNNGQETVRVDSLFNDKNIRNTLYFDDKTGIYGWIEDPSAYEPYVPEPFRTRDNIQVLSQWVPNDNPILVKYLYVKEK